MPSCYVFQQPLRQRRCSGDRNLRLRIRNSVLVLYDLLDVELLCLFDAGEALIQNIRLPLGIDGDLYY
jgi:hypothetical protein